MGVLLGQMSKMVANIAKFTGRLDNAYVWIEEAAAAKLKSNKLENQTKSAFNSELDFELGNLVFADTFSHQCNIIAVS